MLVLGIETSCDETAAAVVRDGKKILSDVVYSQLVHQKYGGVVPELASREHIKTLIPVVQEALKKARVSLDRIQGIAVTYGPGLVGSLLIGLSFAKALSYSLGIPFVGINHLEGHIFAIFLEHPRLKPPFICLIVSGGHSELFLVRGKGDYLNLGKTRDDAAGEAFDKVAKLLDIGYPGGPAIDKISQKGDPLFFRFPRAFLKGSLDFSFSGLKTAVALYVLKKRSEKSSFPTADISASFQEAVVDVLVEKSIRAAVSEGVGKIACVGGVARNFRLREKFKKKAREENLKIYFPSPILCTDNAAMISACGDFRLSRGERAGLDLNAVPYAELV
ncbi:MAG: tRNA threonylcarbamoyladenosine biosynthesis protein TsaB [candidate division Zixibacteria bacterium SM23_73_2]|nr:MAG: tRNA threonylcarbamoyladenosine biosynthesis protein TsaB [candidate division Zixibacteria bacterium SM23_73_2]